MENKEQQRHDCHSHDHHGHHAHHHHHHVQLLHPPKECQISPTLHENNRTRVLTAFKSEVPSPGKNAILFFKGGVTQPIYNDDVEYEQFQEFFFHYLFGVPDLDTYAWINPENGQVTLFVPRYPQSYHMWMKVESPETLQRRHGLHAVYYVDEIETKLKELGPEQIFILEGINTDSDQPPPKPEFAFLKDYKVETSKLYHIIAEVRVTKSEEEIAIMRFVNQLSSQAHVKVMQNIGNGKDLKEYQAEALFKFHVHERAGAKFMAYRLICGSGRDSATLHYIINDKSMKDGAMLLNDMGARIHGYCADITCTFPVNGKFTKHQADIYNAVLDAQRSVIKELKPGTKWDDMHLLAERTIVKHLINLGLITNSPLDELEQKRIGAIFFPHGLGHLIGLQVHDVGGYNPGCPERLKVAGLKSLRTRRVMKEGITITVEPGCYFIDFGIEEALKDPERAKYLNAEKIKEYQPIGGVRIEDVVLITKDGCELLSHCPRTVEEIEKCMAGHKWE